MASPWLNKTFLRLKALVRRRQLDRDLDDELAFHLAMRAEKNRAAGTEPKEASHAARRRFGNIGNVKEQSRAMWTFASLESWWMDVRYATRSLAKNPGFAAVAIAAIALGVGINAGVFSVLNGVALKPLPVLSPDELVTIDQIFHGHLRRNVHGEPTLVSYPEYLSYYQGNHTFSGLLAYYPFVMATLGGGSPKQLFGSSTSCNYFEVLQVTVFVGRAFVDGDCAAPGSSAVVVISDELWRSAFASDPQILGKTIRLNRSPFVVIGIAPPTFRGTDPVPNSFWVPFTMQNAIEPGMEVDPMRESELSWLALLGRLRPGVSLSETRADLSVIAARLDQRHPGAVASLVIRRATFMGRPEEHSVAFGIGGVVLAATGLVLLIACANVANLLLARASTRHKEMALRLSIGASRWRLVRQLLMESLLLALLGGALGSFIAFVSFKEISDFVISHLPPGFPPLALNLAPDWRVAAYAFALTLATGLFFGLIPALQATQTDLNTTFKEDGATSTNSRRGGLLRSSLVGAQVAVCMILLLAAALLMRGLYVAQTVDPGFQMKGVSSVTFDLRSQAYDPKSAAILQKQFMERLSGLPGVDAVAQVQQPPLNDEHTGTEFSLPGRNGEFSLLVNYVSPTFFAMLEIPFVRGRNFTEQETRTGANVAIITEATAREYWPGEDPVGKTIKEGRQRDLQIVGIARDTQIDRLGQTPKPYIYLPEGPQQQQRAQLLVHGTIPFVQAEAAIRAAARSVDPELPLEVTPLADNLEIWRTPSRIVASLSGVLGVLALFLAITGVYGVASYASLRRVREVGIRVALGAAPRDVVGLLLRQVMRPVLIGGVIGVACCAAVSSVLSSMLFGLRSYDPVVFSLVPLFLLGVALFASYLPARRAMRVDPVTALRHE